MEQYIFMAIFFLVGYGLGKASMWKALKKENDNLKKETLILKNHIVSSKKGRIIIQGEEKH